MFYFSRVDRSHAGRFEPAATRYSAANGWQGERIEKLKVRITKDEVRNYQAEHRTPKAERAPSRPAAD
jgi:hypothetical protein